jgi:hypothetical protein
LTKNTRWNDRQRFAMNGASLHLAILSHVLPTCV